MMFGAVAADAERLFEWLRLERHFVKWGSPAAATGTSVTYAFLSGTLDTPEARNCRKLGPIDPLLDRSGIARASFEREAAAAFAMWGAAAAISFRRVADAGSAQIVIGAQRVPRGVAFADVAPDATSTGPIRSIRRALVCLNPEQMWKVGFDGDVGVYDLRYGLAHEIGHAIGLDHPGPSGQLMSFRYDEGFRGLQPGDIAGAVAIYGPNPTDAIDPLADRRPAGAAGRQDCPHGTEATNALTARNAGC